MADSYAIVESGGKQYKVEKGETLLLDRLPAKEGEKVDLRAVMLRDGDVVTVYSVEEFRHHAVAFARSLNIGSANILFRSTPDTVETVRWT